LEKQRPGRCFNHFHPRELSPMGIKCGIVGLPNVGKSTLFNALTKAGIAAANFPFCTIEPNVGIVPVPDPRLNELAGIINPQKVIPTAVEFVDIAGLVAGAASGEGLGNKFLAHIREVDAITHVVRCFEHGDIVHVAGKVDPISDIETIDTELALADLDSVEKALNRAERAAKGGDKDAAARKPVLAKLQAALSDGKAGRSGPGRGREGAGARPVPADPEAGDVHRQRAGRRLREQPAPGSRARACCRRRRAGGAGVGRDRRRAVPARRRRPRYLPGRPGPERAGPEPRDQRGLQPARPADLLHRRREGSPRVDRAQGRHRPAGCRVIHTDFEKGFIRAETIAYDDFIKYKGEAGAKEAGRLRLEGKEYRVQEGDILHFRFNV
jgi:hypothetical protein